jgi:hypothetical protein
MKKFIQGDFLLSKKEIEYVNNTILTNYQKLSLLIAYPVYVLDFYERIN